MCFHYCLVNSLPAVAFGYKPVALGKPYFVHSGIFERHSVVCSVVDCNYIYCDRMDWIGQKHSPGISVNSDLICHPFKHDLDEFKEGLLCFCSSQFCVIKLIIKLAAKMEFHLTYAHFSSSPHDLACCTNRRPWSNTDFTQALAVFHCNFLATWQL